MTIKSIQKVISIGSSAGVTIPSRDLKHANISVGDDIEIIVRKSNRQEDSSSDDVLDAAKDILARYKQDFDNLAQR
jgi:antitoxin component of MazEF toxin-antitoxin module